MTLRQDIADVLVIAAVGGEHEAPVEGGITLLARVRGARRQLVFKRAGQAFGLVETISIRVAGNVPDDAAAVNYPPTADGVHRLSLTWEADLSQVGFDLSPADAAPAIVAPAPVLHTLYTLGYSGWSPAELAATVERLSATLWDIRMSPWSKSPQWQGHALRKLLGARYAHMQALGNLNYKTGGPIDLSDPSAAEEPARRALERGPLILLCGCAEVTRCHRYEAAVWLVAALGVKVEHLAPTRADLAPVPARDAGYVTRLLAEGEPLPEGL